MKKGLKNKVCFQVLILVFISFHVHTQITMETLEEGILIMENQDSVLFYQSTPKSFKGEYERNHYIHPLWNVDGNVLTEDFPADHLHQRGVYWAWHQIIVDGKRTGDGWALEDFTQEVLSTGWEGRDDGSSALTTRVAWKSNLLTKDDRKMPYLLESSDIIVHPRQSNYRKIDFVIRLEAVSAPVGIGGSEDEKGYSGFSIRMKLPDDVQFTGREGTITPQVAAVSSPGYVNVSATFEDDQPGGVVVMDHPDNPEYPQPWILRAKKGMQNAAYPGRDVVNIVPGHPLVLKYSLITYTGNLSESKIVDIGGMRG